MVDRSLELLALAGTIGARDLQTAAAALDAACAPSGSIEAIDVALEATLAALVTRDCLLGVTQPLLKPTPAAQ